MKTFYLSAFALMLSKVLCAQSGFDLTEAQTYINQSEYEIRWQDNVKAFQAPNRNHNLRTTFLGSAVNIKPRVTETKDWSIAMTPIGVFRGDELMCNLEQKFSPVVAKEKISISSDCASVEYVNTEKGLRQNFLVNERPLGNGTLIVKISLETSLIPRFENEDIVFYEGGEGSKERPILTYTDLNVWDVNGVSLKSTMKLTQIDDLYWIELHVNDESAQYPITIDPLTTTPIWVLQGTPTFSMQYAAAGDFNGDGITDLLAGATNYTNVQSNEGAVKLYKGLASGVFDTTAIWSFESNLSGLYMGSRIANAGDVNNDGYDDILIGASYYDNGSTNEGICYVFHGGPVGPSASPNWMVESNASLAEFGHSIASAGDVNADGYDDVVIGAYKHTTSGRVFVYLGGPTGLQTTGTMLNGPGSGNEFGYSVTGGHDLNDDGFDDIVVTGRYRYITGELSSAGRVYIYYGSSTGISTTSAWGYTAKQSSAHLGNAVCVEDVNGDGRSDIIVSAIDYDTIGTNYGLIHVFLNSVSGFGTAPSQLFLGSQADEGLGMTIARLGDINNDGFNDIAVGSPNYDNTNLSTGRIYIFEGGSAGLILNPIMVFTFNESSAVSGRSMAGVGDINADGFDDFVAVNPVYNEPDVGSVLLYYGSNVIEVNIGLWNQKNTTAAFGSIVESMDYNLDGFEDLLIGAPYFDGGSTDEGKLFLYMNDGGYIDAMYDWAVESQQPDCLFALSITDAGDVNGDGWPDIAVGAPYFDVFSSNEGAVFIYFGQEGLFPNEWARQLIHGDSDYGGSLFGKRVKGLGDVNADGFDDILITAEEYAGEDFSYDGVGYIYYGGADGLSYAFDWQYYILAENCATGSSVISRIDINGDDVNDLVISSPYFDGPGLETEGRIDVFYGSLAGMDNIPDWTAIGEGFDNVLGKYLSSPGDINGDGYDDFIASERIEAGTTDSVQLNLFLGSPTGPMISDWHIVRPSVIDQFAFEMEISGDVNGDGYDDVFITTAMGENGQNNEGIVELYYGGLYHPGYDPIVMESNIVSAQFGTSVLGFPDNNGDGADEFVVGAPYQTTNYGQGLVYFFYGIPTSCATPDVAMTTISETTAGVSITGTEDIYYYKWKSEAEVLWHLDSTTTAGFTITGLTACTNYMVTVQAGCLDGYSMWTDVISFTTDCTPCTYAPTGLYVDNITTSSAKLHWNVDPDATKYKVSYRPTGGGAWINVNATSNFKTLPGLTPSTTYQYKVKTVCAGGLQSPFSPVSTFTTLPLREEGAQQSIVSIYPNPVSSILHVEYDFLPDEIKVYDLLGNVAISNISPEPAGSDIDISTLPNGMYTIMVRNAKNYEVVSHKFVKM